MQACINKLRKMNIAGKILLTMFALFILSDLYRRFYPSKACRRLPNTASEIQEKWQGIGFCNDYARILKARLPQEDYLTYAKQLNLKTKYNPSKHDNTNLSIVKTGIGHKYNWWDEPKDFTTCFFDYRPENDFLARIQYKNGYIYYVELTW